jgi:hypothetical protein
MRGGEGTSLDEMHHISMHVCGSCVLGGGRISWKGLTGELGGFGGKSSDRSWYTYGGGTKGMDSFSEDGTMDYPKRVM